jgi:hypothetical protein
VDLPAEGVPWKSELPETLASHSFWSGFEALQPVHWSLRLQEKA